MWALEEWISAYARLSKMPARGPLSPLQCRRSGLALLNGHLPPPASSAPSPATSLLFRGH
eukprot:11822415-Alexandrium_andersonii.AAC.1